MATKIDTSFAVCGGGQPLSFKVSCSGDCHFFKKLPAVTCTTQSGTLSCTNNVACSGDAKYVVDSILTVDDSSGTYTERTITSGCEWSTGFGSDGVVNRLNYTCNVSPNTSGGTPTTNTTIRADEAMTTIAMASDGTSGTATATGSSASTATGSVSTIIASNSAKRSHQTPLLLVMTVLILTSTLINGALAVSDLSMREDTTVERPSGQVVKRFELPTWDWNSLKSGLAPDQLLEVLQDMIVTRVEDHIGDEDKPLWIERDNFIAEIKANLWDDAFCKWVFSKGQDAVTDKSSSNVISNFQEKINDNLAKDVKNVVKAKGPKAFLEWGTKLIATMLWDKLEETILPESVSNAQEKICPNVCAENSELRLYDANNCGRCGNKCASGQCMNGACVVDTCRFSSGNSQFQKCGLGDNAATCTCASSDIWDTGFCVRYQSSSLDLTGDSCQMHHDCEKGFACVKLPTGTRSVCMDATSCLTEKRPSSGSETVPSFGLESDGSVPQPSGHAWYFHARDPEDDGEGMADYAMDPMTLHGINAGLLASDGTINTNCVNVIDTAKQSNTVGAVPGQVGADIPKDYGFYFGYDEGEYLNGESFDQCKLALYTDGGCKTLWDGIDGHFAEPFGGVSVGDVDADIMSWQVTGCSTKYADLPSS